MQVTVYEALQHVKSVVEELLEANSEYSDNEQSREYPNEDRLQKYDDRLTVLEEVKGLIEDVDDLKDPVESVLVEWRGRALPKQVSGLVELLELVEEEMRECEEVYAGMIDSEDDADEKEKMREHRQDISDACHSIEQAKDALSAYE